MFLGKRFLFTLLVLLIVGCSSDRLEDEFQVKALSVEIDPVLQDRTFELVNEYRLDNNLVNSLLWQPLVYEVALDHARRMALSGTLSHADFTERAQELFRSAGAILVGENISRNHPSAEATLEDWLSSKGHKDNILGDFSHTAVAVVRTSSDEIYYIQIFVKIPQSSD